jgi:hypothetical protein
MRHRVAAGAVLAIMAGATLAFLSLAHGQQVHRDGFEGHAPTWVKGTADAVFKEAVHDVTDQTAHSGQYSEHIQLTAEMGSFIYYTYPTGRGPIVEEFSASVWVKANRPGTQLVARVVLPRERNPNNLEEPLTTLVRGDAYQLAGRWQRLELRRLSKLLREQQQLMRAELKRDVDITDAFIDQMVLNVYSGPGLTEVWIDDLEVGPLVDAGPFQTTSRPGGPSEAKTAELGPRRLANRAQVVELNQDQLLVGGKRFFFRGIRYSNTPLKALRDAGFNAVWFDEGATPAVMQEAITKGFWLVPSLAIVDKDPRLVSADNLGRDVTRFLDGDAVLWWDVGSGLPAEQATLIDQAVRVIHGADPQRPVGGDVWDGLLRYSRELDLVGIHRWPLMTSLELPQYREWLDQRRRLARPGTFTWTWVQTHLPDWYTSLVYNQTPAEGFKDPVGPQPEQIRLLTYIALAAGSRGIGFWSDRFLADSHQGQDRLLALALLNQEIQMLEPMLVSLLETPTWIDTSMPEVKAAVLRTEKGVLVLPMWLGAGAQFVPGQAAAVKVAMIIPQVPIGTQAWEISPGNVRALACERVLGGTKITLPEFGLTTAIVFTADNVGPNSLLDRLQSQAKRTRKLAAQWAHDLAEVEMEKVLKVEALLERDRHTLPDGQALIDNARARLARSAEQWNNGDYRQAYEEAQRVLRPLRILMRAQWEQAIRGLDSPVASPYAVSFFTLPQHWQFMDQLRRATVGANVLVDGNFEVSPDRAPAAWTEQKIALDDVELIDDRVPEAPKEGKQCLKLQIKGRGLLASAPSSNTTTPASTPGNSTNQTTGTTGRTPGTLTSNSTNTPSTPNRAAPTTSNGSTTPAPAPNGLPPLGPPGASGTPTAPMTVVMTSPGLERTFLAINSPAVHLPPGTLVRISAWVKIPQAITSSVDGALLYDSAGGESLGIRLVAATPAWKQYTLYRRVPASGTINITLALTGLGTAYFDDVRIEPLMTADSAVSRSR